MSFGALPPETIKWQMGKTAEVIELYKMLLKLEFDIFTGPCHECEGWHEHEDNCQMGLLLKPTK